MATQIPPNSVWSAMTYTPPRGRCNFKTSLMSPACPCLRFMLHPVKAATSFECDGCNHHASFHSLENPAEDAILRKWEAEEKAVEDTKREIKRLKLASVEDARRKAIASGAAPKRKRPQKAGEHEEVRFVEVVDVEDDDGDGASQGMLQKTMALFGAGDSDAGAEPEPEPEVQPVRRARRGKKAVD